MRPSFFYCWGEGWAGCEGLDLMGLLCWVMLLTYGNSLASSVNLTAEY